MDEKSEIPEQKKQFKRDNSACDLQYHEVIKRKLFRLKISLLTKEIHKYIKINYR